MKILVQKKPANSGKPHHRVLTPLPAPYRLRESRWKSFEQVKFRPPATHRKIEKERQLDDGWGEGGGRSQSHGGVKAWSSINHSMLSAFPEYTLRIIKGTSYSLHESNTAPQSPSLPTYTKISTCLPFYLSLIFSH